MGKRYIDSLQSELIELINSTQAFKEHAFTVFNAEDFASKAATRSMSLPLASVTYDGCAPTEGNQAKGIAERTGSVTMVTIQCSVIIAVQYDIAGQNDTKVTAHDLLDDLRASINGYKGVNSRPWVFSVEKPEDPASGDGIVFYSQAWQTSLPVSGKFNRQ